MKLTAILSNYNHSQYLSCAIDALLAQTRPADEIIIFDDASTDNSVSIVERYLSNHPEIIFIRNTSNFGIIQNMNRGLEMAHSEVVYFAAADDVTYPPLFETGMALLERYPQAALFSARCEIINEEGRTEESFPTPSPLSVPGFVNPTQTLKEMLRDDGWFVGGCTLYVRSALVAVGGYPVELGAFCDGYVSRLLALKHGSCYAPVVLSGWRRMEGGMAWTQATNVSAMLDMIKVGEQKMREANGIFPDIFIRRWKGRQLFGARRFSITQQRKKNLAQYGTFRILLAMTCDFVAVSWHFLTLRPWDLLTVARRRWKFRHGRG